MEQGIKNLLDRLSETESHLDALRIKKKDLVDSVIPDAVKDDLNGIDVEFDPKIQNIQDQIKEISEAIKIACIEYGETVKGEYKDVVFYKGRESWDGKLLEGVAVIYPDVLKCKKVGKPYAVVKNKK